MRRLVFLIPFVLIASCGGGSSSGKAETAAPPSSAPPPAASSSPPATVNATVKELKNAVLTISDMPTGFTSAKATPDNKDFFCNKAYPDTSSGEFEVEFDKGTFGPFFIENLRAFPTPAAARASFDAGVKGAQSCTSYVETSDKDKISLAQLSFPKMGDETFAIQETAKGKDGTGVADTVYVLVGNVEMNVAVAGLVADPDLLARMAPKALARIKEKLS